MRGYFWRAWLVCGTLDIGYAALLSAIGGGSPANMLRAVASGPFGKVAGPWGAGGALLGLAVHFAIMAVMVAAYGLLARRTALGRLHWAVAGALYGLALYLVMYWIVLPLRWPTVHPSIDPWTVASALFAHVALVGLPMAFIARRTLPMGAA